MLGRLPWGRRDTFPGRGGRRDGTLPRMTVTPDRAWLRWLTLGLGVLAVVQVLAAAVVSVVVGWSLSAALDAFVVTNAVMGASFAACGALIARHRPRNAIGWLFLADGLGHATTALGAPLIQIGRAHV